MILQIQLAIAWLTSQEGVIIVPTTHNKQHLLSNIAAIKVTIKDEDIEKLRKEFNIKTPTKTYIR